MKIKNILISQKSPKTVNPYASLIEKYNLNINFRQFFVIEPLTSKEFRAQKINMTEYTALVFSSRAMIDAFFTICEEMRIKVPDTLKYFCTTEAVAMYLQKHIVYRKRKIFFGDGTPQSVIDQIGTKHKDERFLIATSADSPNSALVRAFAETDLDATSCVFVKTVLQDIKDLDLNKYDILVFYNKADVESLFTNFPDFKQENQHFFAYGHAVAKAITDAGLKITLQGPTPNVPSVAKGLELALENKD